MTSLAQSDSAGVCLMTNGPASLPAAAALEQGESLQKMAASEASPLIRHALKKKPGKRNSGGTTGVRQQKEELVHAVKNHPRANQLRVGSHSGSAVHSAAPPASSPVTSFSLLDRARPVFSFSSGRKRENGGCIAPAIAGCHSAPPEGRVQGQGLTQIHSSPSRERAISPSTSNLASAARTSSTLGRVAGCRGVNTVQQSS
jgi:hypothetical protein